MDQRITCLRIGDRPPATPESTYYSSKLSYRLPPAGRPLLGHNLGVHKDADAANDITQLVRHWNDL